MGNIMGSTVDQPKFSPVAYLGSENSMSDEQLEEILKTKLSLHASFDSAIRAYLDEFNDNLNQIYDSIFFLLKWCCIDHKAYLEMVLNEIRQKLYLSIINCEERRFSPHYFESQRFLDLNLKFIDLSLKLYRFVNFKQLRGSIQPLDCTINNNPEQALEHVCSLMIKAHPQDITAHLFDLIFEIDRPFTTSHVQGFPSSILKALRIVFIKNDNSFSLISKHQKDLRPNTFEKFLNELDSFLLDDRKFFILYICYGLENYPRRTQRMIKRFLSRVFTNFDSRLFRPVCAPNYIETTNWETLAYLIKSRFKTQTISEDAFYELSYRLIQVSPQIERRFLSCLSVQVPDPKLKFDNFVMRYKRNVKTSICSYVVDRDSLLRRNPQQKNKFYIGRLNHNIPIHFVCDEQGLSTMIQDLTPYDVIAIDAEWLPIFSFKKQTVAIIQIATKDCCYIVDLDNFKEKSVNYKNLWLKFVEEYFSNDAYLKIGYGIGQDLELVSYTTGQPKINLINHIDLTKPSKKLIQFLSTQSLHGFRRIKPQIKRSKEVCETSDNGDDAPNSTNPPTNENGTTEPINYQGLSMLTYIMIGYALDKSEQQSDWTRRPLRDAQLLYAALDAFCLVNIYEKLQKIARVLNFDDVKSLLVHVQSFYGVDT